MKIILLAPANSIHTVQWAKYLTQAGCEVSIISQHPRNSDLPDDIVVYELPYKGLLGYFLNTYQVHKLLKEIKPDVLHAHYASGYGTTAHLVDFHPYVLSVWGSDVYDFPYKSKLHHWLIRKNLYAADQLTSTSHCMMEQTLKIAQNLKPFDVVPFGVDIDKFTHKVDLLDSKKITIGTVKTLSEKYGIDILIKAFAILRENLTALYPNLANKLQLRLVGGGTQRAELEALVNSLDLTQVTTFVGQVSHNQVPDELNKLDVYVALSRWDSESFGVAIIEAEATQRPVVVSNVGGLPEVVQNGKTGFVVPKENPELAAKALERLVLDTELRHQMGVTGMKFVQEHFAWECCVEQMIKVYKKL